MRPASQLLFALLIGLLSIPTLAQTATPLPQPPTRDPQAVSILQNSVKAMGGVVPNDSVATGTITTVAGTETDQGRIRILTKGITQTLVERQMPDQSQTTIFSNGQADNVTGTTISVLPLELAVTSQAPEFPLPFLAGLLNDSDISVSYVGSENSEGKSLLHIRAWKTFASQTDLQPLCSFSIHDIWIDSASGLPQRISFVHRAGQGAVAGMQVDIVYSNYQNSGGTLYPLSIQESQNGTPWATITIQNVSFDTGLSDSNFAVQ